MGTILLISAIIIFVSIFLIFRLYEKYKIDNYQALIVNYLTASVLALGIYSGEVKLIDIPSQSWFIPASILGVFFALSFLLYAISTQRAGMAITAVASKMSVIIPVVAGSIIYQNETLSIGEIAGLLLAMASFYLIFKKEKSEKIDRSLIILPIIILLFSGINDTLMKYIREIYFNVSQSTLNSEILFVGSLFSISFISSLILFGIPLIINRKKIELKNILAGLLLGVFNFASAFTMFKAMGHFESAVFFPIFNVGIVSLSALIGIIFFKEKLSKINYIGLLSALGAILLLTI